MKKLNAALQSDASALKISNKYSNVVRQDSPNIIYPNYTISILKRSGRILLVGDMAAMLLAFVCGGICAWACGSYLFHSGFQSLMSVQTLKQFIAFAGLGALSILWLDMRGHYRQRLPFWEVIGHILSVAMIGLLLCGFVQFAAQNNTSRLWLGLSWVFFGAFLLFSRSVARRLLMWRGEWQIPAILIGEGPLADAAISALDRESAMGFSIIQRLPAEALYQLAKSNAWKRLMASHGASHILLAVEGSALERHQAAIKCLVRERLPFSVIPPWLGLPTGTLSPHHFVLHDVMMVHDTNRLALPLPRVLKRGFDLAVASLAFIAIAPLFCLLILVARHDGGPAFFKQTRIGKHGKKFLCYKFRSMRVDAEAYLTEYLANDPHAAQEWKQFQKLKNDVRITKFGEFLRRTSLDELPQLINVIKGDMSLIGPRPIMPGQEHYYGDDFVYYESVSPGITGPWQVSGRNKLTFKERVLLESCYGRNWSLWMDIVILLKTFPTVLKREQAY